MTAKKGKHRRNDVNTYQQKVKAPKNEPVPVPIKSKHVEQWIHMFLLLLVFLFAYLPCITEKIDIGGDNIGYYHLGKALASGLGYVDIVSPAMPAHNHFPPGYPFLISLFMRLGVDDIFFFSALNGVLMFLSVILMYRLLLSFSISRRVAFVICFFIAFNSGMIVFATMTMSEIAYIFFSLLTFYLLSKVDFTRKEYKDVYFILMTLSAVSTFYIRTSGIALIIAIVCYLLLYKRWRHAVIFFIAFFLIILPWQLRSNALGGNSYVQQLLLKNSYAPELGKAGIADFWARIGTNLSRYITIELPDVILGVGTVSPSWAAGIIILSFVLYGAFRLIRVSKAQPILMYLIFSAGIVLLWPEMWTGIRFVLPLVPCIILFLVYGISSAAESLLQRAKVGWNPYILCFPVFFLIPPLRTISEKADEPYPPSYQNYFNIAEWAKSNLPDSSVICCRKPELFYFFSERKSVSYPFTQDTDSLLHSLEKANVDYVVIEQLGYSSTRKYLLPAINKSKGRFKVVYMLKNPETYLLKFNQLN